MKQTIIRFIFIFFPSLIFSQEGLYLFAYFVDNGQDGLHFAYSRDGHKWDVLNGGKSYLKPDVGKDKLMRDPCIIQSPDGTFHLVWTSGWHDQIIGHASSKDLVNWSTQNAIPVMLHEPTAKNAWAPELFYNERKKNYLIFWATTIPARHSDIADSEKEKGLNHRIYYTETTDFITYSKTKMFFNPTFSSIDATILKDGKNFYMFVKNENPNPPQKNIRIIKSKNPLSFSINKISDPITGKFWAEGPSSIRIGDYVYVYFDKYRDHKYGGIRSRDMKSWEDISDQLSFPKGIRHGTVFKVSQQIFNNLNVTNKS